MERLPAVSLCRFGFEVVPDADGSGWHRDEVLPDRHLHRGGHGSRIHHLSMVREVVFGVGFALLLPRFFGLDGVLYSMPLSDILTFLIAGYLIYKTYHELNYHIALDSGERH